MATQVTNDGETKELAPATSGDGILRVGSHEFHSRLIVGTGKYETFDIMRDAIDLSGAECLTVAVRRERL